MSLFVSAEQRAASRAFDQFIEHTDAALRNPMVLDLLGDTALALQRLNATAFLPNMRSGRFVEPRRQRKTANIAFVPITDEQAGNVENIISPLGEISVKAWILPKATRSERYGLDLEEEFATLFYRPPNGTSTDTTHSKSLPESVQGRMHAVYGKTEDGKHVLLSRPTLLARTSLIEQGALACASVVGHEYVHGEDMLEDGPLFGTPTYRTAAELRAYGVSTAICASSTDYSPIRDISFEVEQLRKQEIGMNAHPFKPTPRIMQIMAEWGVV